MKQQPYNWRWIKLLDLTLELAKGTGVKVICGAGSNDTQTA